VSASNRRLAVLVANRAQLLPGCERAYGVWAAPIVDCDLGEKAGTNLGNFCKSFVGGQLAVGSGQCAVGSGQCAVGSGQWGLVNAA
jgi:hypothetical protein